MHRWPPSGFHMQTAVWMPEGDGALATRFVRTCARNPVALERLTDDRATKAVTCRYKSDGPTAGPETVDPLAFVARVVVYGPDTGQVTTRHGAGHDPTRGRSRPERRLARQPRPEPFRCREIRDSGIQ